jgi:hypothetical protein
MCVCVCVCWELQFEKRKRFGERLYLLQEVGNFGLKEDHNATWRWAWNNKKSSYKKATKLGSFPIKFVCFFFFFLVFLSYAFIPFLFFF